MALSGGSINPEYLKHYDLLKSIGIWEEVDELKREIKGLEELFSEAIEIFNQEDIQNLVAFVTSRLLNKFIPGYLVFVLEESPTSLFIQIYQNLKVTDETLDIPNLDPYKNFFADYPNPLAFDLFEHKTADQHDFSYLKKFRPDIIVPVVGIGGVHGFILFGEKIVDRGYSDHEISYIHRLMKFTSIGLQNYIHHQSSITDAKTGMYNHSYFSRRLTEEVSRLKRYGSQISLLILDIDFFKKFNDTYGHLAGDHVLNEISQVIQGCIREEDIAARFGGEEFVVLLIECSVDAAWTVAERIRNSIAAEKVIYDEQTLSVTVSIGGAYMNGMNRLHPSDFLDKADEALYQSKKNGRNKTTFYNPGLFLKAKQLRESNS
jgi:diguanylate cyclase (GGDEF)-like protein